MTAITWVEWVGVVAFITNVWGNWALAKLKSTGWIIRLVTNVLWIVYSAHTWGGWPLMLNHVAFFVLNIVGWIKWRKAKQSGETVK